ncbi:MAG: tyrosine--tRNA ligase [Bacteroidota bacterium]
MKYLDELRWRGLLQDSIPGTAEFLNANPSSGYLGVDPTKDSIHIGNLVSVMMLVHLQRAGHTPYALVGGATAMVGDPSGKSEERNLMSVEEIRHNAACVKEQLAHFLDFETKINPAQMVNNYDWLGTMGFLEFLRDVGKHLTINYMMGKESVKRRLAGDSGISYTEFAYQLLQGYDYLHLYQHHGVRIQVGGSDQWGNITTGTELIRRALGAKAYAAVCPLLTDETGNKMGKTAGGKQIWLSSEYTSPYEFYQYWLQLGDLEAAKCIKIFTLKEQEEIEGLIATHAEAPHQRALQAALAADVTKRVHGTDGLNSAEKLTAFLFSKNTNPEALAALSEADWQGIIQATGDILQISRDRISGGINIMDLLAELKITQSKGEARRAILKDRSIRVNAERCEDIDLSINLDHAFHGRYFQLQKGKKNRYLVELV